jgi:hypothetical protein
MGFTGERRIVFVVYSDQVFAPLRSQSCERKCWQKRRNQKEQELSCTYHHKQAARESASTNAVKSRRVGDHVLSAPRLLLLQSVSRKKRTWSVLGRSSVQSCSPLGMVKVGATSPQSGGGVCCWLRRVMPSMRRTATTATAKVSVKSDATQTAS